MQIVVIKPIRDEHYSHTTVAYREGQRVMYSESKGQSYEAAVTISASAACFKEGQYEVVEIDSGRYFPAQWEEG